MLEIRKGDIFQSGCEAICNAVNCIGVMGAGLAAAFRVKYPKMFLEYKEVCNRGELSPGKLHAWTNPNGEPIVINFPTKTDLRDSEYIYIDQGLVALNEYIKVSGIKSVAIPALGCGLGGLEWATVLKKIQDFHDQNWVDMIVAVYEPH
jgi:O-acetyl-ADP-ribose deacetylase (regulator of RNase III)